MKRTVSILLAVMMLVSVFAIPAAARGYTLSVPNKKEIAHNLEAFGLHTLNVYSTLTPPTIDGKISTGEYPGPYDGCSLSAVIGDNLFIVPAVAGSYAGDQKGYNGRTNVTDFVHADDKAKFIDNYLTYDDEYFYFGVSAVIPAIRDTSKASGTSNYDETVINSQGKTLRESYWRFYTFVNFMQSEDVAQVNNTLCWMRYRLYKGEKYHSPQSVSLQERELYIYDDSLAKYVTTEYGSYTDPEGVNWNATTYKAASNFFYQAEVIKSEKKDVQDQWAVTFEGRMPLGDVLRFTDVEYEDGTPIDYVPGWGSWGCAVSYQAGHDYTSYTPNGTKIEIKRNDPLYAQTGLPARGYGENTVGAYVGGYLFSNTIQKATGVSSIMNNPVRFLGVYDPNYVYEDIYRQPEGDPIVSTTTRVTRTRSPKLTSGVRGVNNRVVGVATTAASATGDSTTLTVVLSVAMVLCAAGAVAVVAMRKRSRYTR
ncbi:MAG: hypothetical protein IKT50_00930 [Clostridia bacterium]|nr:hypothetical protein [Clostridia bacterium]